MEVSLNNDALKKLIAHEIGEVTDYKWCYGAESLLAQFKDKDGTTTQILLRVTQEDEQFIGVADDHTFPITVEE